MAQNWQHYQETKKKRQARDHQEQDDNNRPTSGYDGARHHRANAREHSRHDINVAIKQQRKRHKAQRE
jgi:hypothetical protein